MTANRIGIVLLAMGGPNKPEDVTRYLHNIFSDREIIKLPGGTIGQVVLSFIISRARTKKVRAHYALIGGASPLLGWTKAQQQQMLSMLKTQSTELNSYIGMRYIEPGIEEAVEQAHRDGCRRLIFLPLYPHYCRATTGSSFSVAAKALKRYPDLSAEFIKDFHAHPRYIALVRDYIQKHRRADETLLFSAHAIPQSFVDDGDPYVDQVRRTAELAADGIPYVLSFQSRTGPVEWVGPDTVETVKRLVVEEQRRVFIVPISFVCDHIETLYEIDIELKQLIGELYAAKIRRMPMFNADPLFGELLADLVMEKWGQSVRP